MYQQNVQSILSSHKKRLHDIWRVSNDMIAQHGETRKAILHGYTEPCVNDAMDIAMRAIKGRCRGPSSPIVVEIEMYFNAMRTVQFRSEEFFAQYENGNGELQLSGLADDRSNKKPESNANVRAQEQALKTQRHQPTECKYFPRRHHITGKRIGWTKSRIIWQYELHLEMERTIIHATAPQALLSGRTKKEIMVHVSSVLNDLYTAAKKAAVESENVACNLIHCHTWVNEKIYLRQVQWISVISNHLNYLVEKLKADTMIEQEREKFLQRFNRDWEDGLKIFARPQAHDWARSHRPDGKVGTERYIEWAQEEVNKLLKGARAHIEYVKLSHKEDEAACQWEFEFNELYSELQRQAEAFMAEQEKMVECEFKKEA